MTKAVPLLACALLLAGCLDGDRAAAGDTPAFPGESPALDAGFRLTCEGTSSNFAFPADVVQRALPDGYVPFAFLGIAGAASGEAAGTAGIAIKAFVCDVATADASYQDVPLAWVYTPLAKADGHEVEDGGDSYLFEWLLPVSRAPALADWLAARGWPVQDAEVTVGAGLFTARGPGIDYEVRSAAGSVETTVVPGGASGDLIRYHRDDGRWTSLDEHLDVAADGTADATLVATSGFLADLVDGESATVAQGMAFLRFTVDDQWVDGPSDP